MSGKNGSTALFRLLALAAVVLLILAGYDLYGRGVGTGHGQVLGLFSPKWALGLAAYGVAALALSFVCLRAALEPPWWLDRWLPRLEAAMDRLGAARWLMAGGAILAPSVILLGPWGWRFPLPWFRLLLALGAGTLAGLALPQARGGWVARATLATLLATSAFLLGKRLIWVSDYPFPLGWSEGNRLWDYSLYFARERYQIVGEFAYPTYLTPGRHGLWGLPFLFFPQISIAGMRLWDALLWTLPYLLFGLALFLRRQVRLPATWRLVWALWSMLFISQGPVYAPLVLSAALLAWGFDPQRLGRTLGVTALACFYAGISRWTWMAAPAIWAGMWMLIAQPRQKSLWRQALRPIASGIAGLAGGAAALGVMQFAIPRPDPIYATSLSHDLLWYRLWKSSTNPEGIVPALVYTVGPLLLWLAWRHARSLRGNALPLLGILGGMGAFLAAGLVASVKIGGGSNLHNLDMFLVGLVFLAGWSLGHLGLEGTGRALPGALLVAVLVIPVWNAIKTGGPAEWPPGQAVKEALAEVRFRAQEAAAQGEVLFIDQRQLLTFGYIEDVPLVMDYELKHMMNQAMGRNKAYFARFESDLARHRFSLIISDPLPVVYKRGEGPFPEENDLWVDQVTLPILRYYEPTVKIPEFDIWLLVPRQEVGAGEGD